MTSVPFSSGEVDPYRHGHRAEPYRGPDAPGHGGGGAAPKRVVVAYGFWIFLLSDIVMFSCLFASYAVLVNATADGPSGHDIFSRGSVAIETACLLASSFTCGLASLAMEARSKLWFYVAMAVTGLLGLGFLYLEANEFIGLIAQDYGPDRSAFLTAFFTLVGCHGLHVSVGILWLLTMMAQVFAKGFRPDIERRVFCFALFWHTLDIIWVAIFSLVYLMGIVS